MRRLLASVSAALLVGLAVSSAAPAGPSTGAASLTVRLISTVDSSREVDLVPKGRLSKGDRIYVHSLLRNAVAQFGRSKGALVGSDDAVVTVLTPPTISLKVAVKLPGGTLRVQGRASALDTSPVLEVLGGTGAFAGARGVAEAKQLSAARTLNVYRLRLP